MLQLGPSTLVQLRLSGADRSSWSVAILRAKAKFGAVWYLMPVLYAVELVGTWHRVTDNYLEFE